MDGLFLAVVEAVEEAVLNSLCAAETTTGRGGGRADVEGVMIHGEAGGIGVLLIVDC